ncbi:MAG: hypothetical protein ACLFU9_07720 [Candidatus Bathyarchaeia archaeon]
MADKTEWLAFGAQKEKTNNSNHPRANCFVGQTKIVVGQTGEPSKPPKILSRPKSDA